MKIETNPYSPGAGRLPVAFVGRQRELDVWAGSLRRIMAGRDARSLVLTGLRGMGKTVLLTNFAQTARDNKWLVAQVEAGAGKGLRQLIAERFQAQLSDIARGGAGKRSATAIKSLLSFVRPSVDPMTGSWSFGLDFSGMPGGADTGILEADLGRVLTDLTEVAKERGVGVALLVDEAQALNKDELAAFCQTIQSAGQAQAPLLVALAGLPNLPVKLAEAKTYAERLFDYHTIGALTPQESRDALLEPAAQEHVDWSNEAADLVLDSSHGYPYFIQQFGSDTWDAASESPITPDIARIGLATGKASLDAG
ncbi:MAG: AAA family ATPase, partial [Propionibacteriaceae bacterium]|nr:AAA family ATPase [Propionibacteriaceae bacterium]